jgi:hypothetical protein
MGEGALPKIKASIKSLKGKWALHATQRWYDSRTLDKVLAQLLDHLNCDPNLQADQLLKAANELLGRSSSGEEEDEAADEDSSVFDDFHIYRDMDEVSRLFETSTTPLSVIGFTGTGVNLTFGIVYKEKQDGSNKPLKKILPISLSGLDFAATSYYTCGATYFKWAKHPLQAFKLPDDADFIKSCGVVLPNHNNSTGDSFFYLVTSDWEEMLDNGTVGKPKAVGCTYE